MICFFWNIRLFFIGKNTLAAHYFPIISTFVLAVGVCGGVSAAASLHQQVEQQPAASCTLSEASSCRLVFTSLISTVSD